VAVELEAVSLRKPTAGSGFRVIFPRGKAMDVDNDPIQGFDQTIRKGPA
jgi:hypothetical protein